MILFLTYSGVARLNMPASGAYGKENFFNHVL